MSIQNGTRAITTALWMMVASQIAGATIIDTFSFTQVGWTKVIGTSGIIQAGAPDPGGMLSGTFSGVEEASGLIGQADLTSFSATYSDSNGSSTQAQAPFFSYNVNGGASSLSFAGFLENDGFCAGQAIFLLPACFNFNTYPAGTNGLVHGGAFPIFITQDQPTITLVSRITEPPPPSPVAAPEPASFLLVPDRGGDGESASPPPTRCVSWANEPTAHKPAAAGMNKFLPSAGHGYRITESARALCSARQGRCTAMILDSLSQHPEALARKRVFPKNRRR